MYLHLYFNSERAVEDEKNFNTLLCTLQEEKLKSKYPNLPICMLGDSLYACEPVFEICDHNKWKYLLRFKEGSISSVAKEFNMLMEFDGKKNGNCTWFKDIIYNQRTF